MCVAALQKKYVIMDKRSSKAPERADTNCTEFHGLGEHDIVKFVSTVRALLCRVADFVPVLVILLFLGTLFWAKRQDPFSRKWFSVSADGGSFECVAVLPKPVQRRPVVVYAHGSRGDLMTDGNDVRQMAEMGLAVVSLEYNQSNRVAFNTQFELVQQYLDKQKWVDTNAVIWVGFSQGANRIWDFSQDYQGRRPKLLVQLSGRGLERSTLRLPFFAPKYCVLLVHGGQDEVFPVADSQRLASMLQSNGVPVELKIIAGLPHELEPDRKAIFRFVGEYCRAHVGFGRSLVTSAATSGWWQDYHSIAQGQADAPSLPWFCLPAAAWVVGWAAWRRRQRRVQLEGPALQRSEIVLRWLAAILGTWALIETSLHLLTPHFPVSDRTLAIARRILVQDKDRADFEALAGRPIWKDQKLRTLLDHVELAVYNRELINWRVAQTNYEENVLNPVITGKAGEQFNWRRQLWEEFYPRIRHESSPLDAAVIVVRHLRERVTVVAGPNLPHEVPDIWLRQLTDQTGFEIIYVAALRSVGVPARLDPQGQTELFAEGEWQAAPAPVVMAW